MNGCLKCFVFAFCFSSLCHELLAQATLTVDLGNGVGLELIRVTHGDFEQGSPESELDREADEAIRSVSLTQDFYLGKNEVTFGQFQRFVEETRYRTEAESGPSGGYGLVSGKMVQRPDLNWKNPGYPTSPDRPATIVTVRDAQAFCNWLSGKAKRQMALPTEAQWEYACRAGTKSRFYLGDAEEDLDQLGWHQGNAAEGPMPIGQKQPNAWGFYDLSGNVYEWCQDVYHPNLSGNVSDPLQTNPLPGEPTRIVLRGGSFFRAAKRCRSAARYRATPGTRNAENGFRVASMELISVPVAPAAIAPMPVNPAPVMETPFGQAAPPIYQPSPVPFASRSSSMGIMETFAGGIICLGFVLVVVMPLVFFLMPALLQRKRRRSQRPSPRVIDPFVSSEPEPSIDRGPPHIRLTPDGFWLQTANYAVGSVIYYRYWAGDQPRQASVEIEHSTQQFVYTGEAPHRVEISDVEPHDENQAPPRPVDSDLLNPSAAQMLGRALGTFSELHPYPNSSSSSSSSSTSSEEVSGGAGFPPAYS